MTRSMTAFINHEKKIGNFMVGWEIRTVNHRYLDLSLHLPEPFRHHEADYRKTVTKINKRGKVECTFRRWADVQVAAKIELNEHLVKELAAAAETIEQLMNRPLATATTIEILNWPGVMQSEQIENAASLEESTLALLHLTLSRLVEIRDREGCEIAGLIKKRCSQMRQQTLLAQKRVPTIINHIRSKLQQRVSEIDAQPDNQRLEQEIVYLLQKMDVDEELERLATHIKEVERLVEPQEEPVGRRLDFLMQEMNREANTLGSKSVDIETTKISVELKVLIEQIREQVQNVE